MCAAHLSHQLHMHGVSCWNTWMLSLVLFYAAVASARKPPEPPEPPSALEPALFTVVGAGPGGLLAAHILSQRSATPASNGLDQAKVAAVKSVRLLERGNMPLQGTYTLPFSDTYRSQPRFPAALLNGVPVTLAGVFGGQQTDDAGIYAPGTSNDLAKALELDLDDASAIQRCTALPMEEVTLDPASLQLDRGIFRAGSASMAAVCTTQTSCDWGNMLLAAPEIRRRSVAHGLHGVAAPPYAELDASVDRVVFDGNPDSGFRATAVVLVDGSISPVPEGGAVVLAAGSLGSAAILARSLPDMFGLPFEMFNHYVTTATCDEGVNGLPLSTEPCPLFEAGSVGSHWFSEFETPGSVNCSGQPFELQHHGNFLVLRQMAPTMRGLAQYDAMAELVDIIDTPTSCDRLARTQAEQITVDTWGNADLSLNTSDSPFTDIFRPWEQAGHFAGGIPLERNSSKVQGTLNVFSADGGAIREPFASHAPMVSAAAGVRAAMEMVGEHTAECTKYMPGGSTARCRKCRRGKRKKQS